MNSGTFQQRIDRLTAKMEMLRLRIEDANRQLREASDEIAQRDSSIKKLNRQIDLLNQETENLRVVHAITPRRDEINQTRSIIIELMRDIDRCIADIGE